MKLLIKNKINYERKELPKRMISPIAESRDEEKTTFENTIELRDNREDVDTKLITISNDMMSIKAKSSSKVRT